MLVRKKLPATTVKTNSCVNILLRNHKEEEALMVQLANGKHQNSEENCLLVHLKLNTESMLKFMLSMRRT